MSRVRMLVSTFGAAALAVAGAWSAPAAAGAVGTGGGWGRAIAVPGVGAMNAGRYAYVFSVSCGSAGNCAAGGSYIDSANRYQGWVASEQNGSWHRAIEVPALPALNAGGNAHVLSVSCGSAGNCAAGGLYTGIAGHQQAWVASEQNGRWHRAIEVPGSGALNAGGNAEVFSVSCRSAGNCTAGGAYSDVLHHFQAFAASEQNGRWHWAIEVPGSGALNAGGNAAVDSVSCGSAGNCTAAGEYTDVFHHFRAFVASEQNGRWHRAIEVPGFGGLNSGGNAFIGSVSCGSAGNCAVGGHYSDGSGHYQAFVASEQNGRWRAIQVPGSAALNAGGYAQVSSVSCGSAGNCAAGGLYTDAFHHQQAFVASEQNGRWHRAIQVPGFGGLTGNGNSQVYSVSCRSAGNCAAGGSYLDGSGASQAFVASAQNGRWHTAEEVPGSGALNAGGDAYINSVSCPSAGICAAGGAYMNASGAFEAFVVSQA